MSVSVERLAFTYRGAAELLDLSESTVRTLVREGQLESVLIRRCRRIPRDAILALLTRREESIEKQAVPEA